MVRLGKDIFEDVSVGIEGRQRNRLVRLSRIQVRRGLLLPAYRDVGILMSDNMSAVTRLEKVLLVGGAVLGGMRDGSHGEMVDARDLGGNEVGRWARQ